MKIRRTTALIAYWTAALIIVAMILLSLDYSFTEALFMSSLFSPGVVAAKFFLSQAEKGGSNKAVINAVYIFGAIAVMEFLLIVVGHRLLEYIEEQSPLYLGIGVSDILVNPVFVAVIILLILAGEHLVRQKYKETSEVRTISFTSDRHKMIMNSNEISYIESNDSEVWVVANDRRRFRNKTGISQWENLLGKDFIRVHRSYLVRKELIQETLYDSLTLADGTSIPVSRKYRDIVGSLSDN